MVEIFSERLYGVKTIKTKKLVLYGMQNIDS